MRAAGVETVINSDELAIMGILEVTRALPKFLHAFRQLKRAACERSPDAVVLVDWPEFNLRLATALHQRGLKVIYYISPQLWAWRPRRINRIKRDIDLLLSILPFVAECVNVSREGLAAGAPRRDNLTGTSGSTHRDRHNSPPLPSKQFG